MRSLCLSLILCGLRLRQGVFEAEKGVDTFFFIAAYDANGNQLRQGGEPFHAVIENQDLLYELPIQDRQDGTYLVPYILSKP